MALSSRLSRFFSLHYIATINGWSFTGADLPSWPADARPRMRWCLTRSWTRAHSEQSLARCSSVDRCFGHQLLCPVWTATAAAAAALYLHINYWQARLKISRPDPFTLHVLVFLVAEDLFLVDFFCTLRKSYEVRMALKQNEINIAMHITAYWRVSK